ncbi:MAG: glycosyltransferase [Chloroflexota bacterium]
MSNVSVIIPAYNAAKTIGETLESVSRQQFQDWEAIVINDGSTDETVDIVQHFIDQDHRFRLIAQENQGVAGARNAGIAVAKHERLLFLDADDWLLPPCLAQLTAILTQDPTLDAAYGGWTRVSTVSDIGQPIFAPPPMQLFESFARYCAFAIHACLFRRSLALDISGFDTQYTICDDWDFWQRLVRVGAKFASVSEALVGYRIRPESLSLVDGPALLKESLQIIDQGHRPDLRLNNPALIYEAGVHRSKLPEAQMVATCWAAGLMLGSHQNPDQLLTLLSGATSFDFRAEDLADAIFRAALLPGTYPISGWDTLWDTVEPDLVQFLSKLEEKAQASGLTTVVRRRLESLVLQNRQNNFPVEIGQTYGIQLDGSHPIVDVQAPSTSERLHCRIAMQDQWVGWLELPVCDGYVKAEVLADAISSKFAWQILEIFLKERCYPGLHIESTTGAPSLWYGSIKIADNLQSAEPDYLWAQAFGQVGWLMFLQEVWGQPDWPSSHFYDVSAVETPPATWQSANVPLTLELGDDFPDLFNLQGQQDITVAVGGATLGQITLPLPNNCLTAHQLQIAITQKTQFELCRLAVREGVLGQPVTRDQSLRQRLAARAKQRLQHKSTTFKTNGLGVILGQSYVAYSPINQARYTCLPAALSEDLIAAARSAGEPVTQSMPVGDQDRIDSVRFDPEFIKVDANVNPGSEKYRSQVKDALKLQATSQSEVSSLPILCYDRITLSDDENPSAMSRYFVDFAAFKDQLQYLQDAGFYSISLADWQQSMAKKIPLPGRPLLITFDYLDTNFRSLLWPVLLERGFSAMAFPSIEDIQDTAVNVGWETLQQLYQEGLVIGARGVTPYPLTGLSTEEVVRELAQSRLKLQQALGIKIDAFAYPYGDVDAVVQNLVGGCGFTVGVTHDPRQSTWDDTLLSLPRLRIERADTIVSFSQKLELSPYT